MASTPSRGRGPGDEYTVLAVIPFGYPVKAVGLGKKRRNPLGDVVSAEHVGTAFK